MRTLALAIGLIACGEPAAAPVAPAAEVPPPPAPSPPPEPPCVHDPPGPCEVREWIDREGEPRVRIREYEDGRLVHEIVRGGPYPPYEAQRRYVLDAHGHVAEEHVTSSGGSSSITRWVNDEHGHPIEIRVRLDGREDESFERHVLTHDGEGNLIRDERWAVPLGVPARTRVERVSWVDYELDTEGRWIRASDGSEIAGVYRIVSRTFDAHGEVVEVSTTWTETGRVERSTNEVRYDACGNVIARRTIVDGRERERSELRYDCAAVSSGDGVP